MKLLHGFASQISARTKQTEQTNKQKMQIIALKLAYISLSELIWISQLRSHIVLTRIICSQCLTVENSRGHQRESMVTFS